jgi:ubiquinol-cytochrome c reductase cytochrome b subunit
VDDQEKEVTVVSKTPNLPSRMFRWLDKRTGVHDLMKESLDEPIPGGARLAYVFGSGLLFIFISQIITGICLALYYVPSAESAHTSVAYISKQVAAGAFLRSLHYYGSSAMIIVLALHFLQTFLYGSFKGRRELLWISGAVLSFLVLGMGFTGYLLPWDQKAYFATAVGTNIVGQIPLIGNWLTRLLRGGDTLGTLTLSRFYVAHVFLLPAGLFAFIAAHIFLFRKAGPAGPIEEDPVTPKMAPEGFYPRQVLMDMAFAFLIMIGLGVLSFFHPASLGPVANPADTQFLPRPEWYYLPMFEWLKYFEGPKVVFAVVVIPGILATLFFLMPFLDRSLERRPWRRPIPVLAVAFVMLGMIYLGIKSRVSDRRDPTVAAQTDLQDEQEKAYSKAPFEPFNDSPGGQAAVPTGPVSPLVAQGRAIFEAHGCAACHGEVGLGGPAGPTLVGITAKYANDPLVALLHNPDAKMKAGRMPAVDISSTDMSALVAYLGVIGTSAANVQSLHDAPAPEIAGAPGRYGAPANGAQVIPAAGGGTTGSAAAGQQFFQSHGCFACHGEAGMGGRAPALAPSLAHLSNAQLATLLAAPNDKMKAGGMAPVVASAEELGSLVAYLRTLAPPRQTPVPDAVASGSTPALAPAAQPEPASVVPSATEASTASAPPPTSSASVPVKVAGSAHGGAIFVAQGCAACHGKTGAGTGFAVSLIGSTTKFPGDKLTTLLRQPTAKMRSGGMPAVTLSEPEMAQLVAYLSTLGTPQSAIASTTKAAPGSSASGTNTATGAAGPAAGNLPHPSKPVVLSADAIAGQKIFVRSSCESCHGVGGLHGTLAAPGLAGTASILPAAVLENLMRHHSTQMNKGDMPATNLNRTDMKSLVAFIRSMPDPADNR